MTEENKVEIAMEDLKEEALDSAIVSDENSTLIEVKKDEDDDEKFIKKDSQEKLEEAFNNLNTDITEVVEELKDIKLAKTQERNLARETGGLEDSSEVKAPQTKVEEKKMEDVWDNRSEEVDNMAVDVFNSTGMRSVVWQQKRKRLKEKKEHVEAAAAGTVVEESMVQKIKKLKQDRSNDIGNNQGAGAWR